MLVSRPRVAQPRPGKAGPLHHVTTGASEVVGRLIAQGMTDPRSVNRFSSTCERAPGAISGRSSLPKRPPDGYTVQITQSHTVNVSLYRGLTADVARDFAPVTKTNVSPLMVVVHPSLPAKSVADLVRLAKARPDAISYSSAGAGTSTFLAAELFRIVSGVNILENASRPGDFRVANVDRHLEDDQHLARRRAIGKALYVCGCRVLHFVLRHELADDDEQPDSIGENTAREQPAVSEVEPQPGVVWVHPSRHSIRSGKSCGLSRAALSTPFAP